MSEHHHRPAPRRQPVLGRNQRLLLLASLALAVFWFGAATFSVYAVAGSLLLGGAALALSLDPDKRPPADPADAPCAVERAAQAMTSGWSTSWEHSDDERRQEMLAWARAAIRAYQIAQQTTGADR